MKATIVVSFASSLVVICSGEGWIAAAKKSMSPASDKVSIVDLITQGTTVDIKNCGTRGTDAMDVNKFTLDPMRFKVVADGVLARDVTGGNLAVKTDIGGGADGAGLKERFARRFAFLAAGRKTKKEPLCDHLSRTMGVNSSCPLRKGKVKIPLSLGRLPPKVFAGRYVIETRATDLEGKPIFCFAAVLNIPHGPKGEVVRALEGHNKEDCKRLLSRKLQDGMGMGSMDGMGMGSWGTGSMDGMGMGSMDGMGMGSWGTGSMDGMGKGSMDGMGTESWGRGSMDGMGMGSGPENWDNTASTAGTGMGSGPENWDHTASTAGTGMGSGPWDNNMGMAAGMGMGSGPEHWDNMGKDDWANTPSTAAGMGMGSGSEHWDNMGKDDWANMPSTAAGVGMGSGSGGEHWDMGGEHWEEKPHEEHWEHWEEKPHEEHWEEKPHEEHWDDSHMMHDSHMYEACVENGHGPAATSGASALRFQAFFLSALVAFASM